MSAALWTERDKILRSRCKAEFYKLGAPKKKRVSGDANQSKSAVICISLCFESSAQKKIITC